MKMYMIGNAHLDPVWTWTWIEGYSEIISTCISALNILDNYESAVFTRGEAAMYNWIDENHPEITKRINHYIKKGKWNIVNGWWIQPDCNIPSGECFVRQALYGKKYFEENFNVSPKIAYNVDSFGHAGSLPQILKKSEFDGYVFMRPGKHEKNLPSVFKWESSDGSSIPTFRISNAYTVHEDDLSKQIEFVKEDSIKGIPFSMCFYGVGNHGGGPTKAQIEFIENKKIEYKEKNIDMQFGTPDDYFKELNEHFEKLDVVNDELQYHAIGCYSVHSKIKKLNRVTESELNKTEKWSAVSTYFLSGWDHTDKIEELWKNLLFNQFHDILAGSSIKEAYIDAERELGGVISDSKKVRNYALQNISKKINTYKAGIPFIVFNSSSFDRNEYIEFEPWLGHKPWGKNYLSDYIGMQDFDINRINWNTHILVDENNKEIEYQKIDALSPKRFVHRILFKTKIPAMGYKVLWLKETKEIDENQKLLSEVKGEISNGIFNVIFDNNGFKILNTIDDSKVNWAASNKFIMIDDKSDTWSHDISSYDGKSEELPLKNINLIENGNLRAVLKLVFSNLKSEIVQYVEIRKNDPKITMRFKVNWQDKHKVLKYKVSFNDKNNVIAEIPYSTIERVDNGQEYPMQRFTLIENEKENCFALMNDSKYSYDFRDNDLRLTILRSVPYAWHDPYELKEDKEYSYIDMGIQEFNFSFMYYKKEDRIKVIQQAETENNSLDVFSVPKFKGDLPAEKSFIKLISDKSVITSVKLSEDKKADLIIRIVNYCNEEDKANLVLFDSDFEIQIGHNEIKTFRYDGCNLTENNLLER